ncbi:MAG TPA: bifunctional homocysteine S-methyltransferase/methylenetetrahydrofolate reductase [Candidatus Eremiobacteraceae bacterium]|nr:bifunctional homocysteine S-methyltransferase/methylenetetrahydrofolate reductase [Candidatus Eremiobacteraceae bacterium]
MQPITSRWNNQLLVADGAMGTLLLNRGADVAACVEVLNLDEPAAVTSTHRDYLAAGAQILETNTFAANRVKLAAHEQKARLSEINTAGVALARAAAGDRAYVAGSIGPLGALLRPLGIVGDDEAIDIFGEHIAALAAGKPDLLILETFGSARELLLALRAAKKVAPRLPLLASLSVMEDGKTPGGDPLRSAWERLHDAGADAVGINCAVGPQAVYDALAPLAGRFDIPISVMPNAGYPQQLDDRTVYESSPAYFHDFARRFAELGASIIGGCCGTTPAHIAAIARAIGGSPRQTPAPIELELPRAPVTVRSASAARPATTAFETKLGKSFVLTVEVSPPRGASADDSVAAARILEAAGADAVDISDNPTARLRMSSTALAHLIMRETRLATILHMTCRDRNLLGLQSELLGAAALGVSAILALTGDPSNVGDFPKATSVFDVTAVGLTEIVHALNQGKDHAGNDVGAPTRFRVGVAVNPTATNLTAELAKFDEKIAAGADFAMTQPVFDIAASQPFLELAAQRRLPVIVGVLLLRSHRNAEFLHNEVPGMSVPDAIRERMRRTSDGSAEGIAIASELLVQLAGTPGVGGAYLLPQERYEAAAEAMARARGALPAVSR